ncbi:hypothetical protein PLESTM_001216400 [Pleodorina starrii]|nr:hypothetical protein PLESTM_001216400 [Pleodorina starrii]
MVNKKGKGAKTKGSKPPAKKPQQERVTLVRPLWETLEQEERVKLLSIDLDSVRSRAKQLAEAARQQAVADAPEGEPLDPALLELEPSIEDVLEEGIKRLKEKGTWKLWQWPADNSALYDAESFRQHITEKHIREELRRLLPRDEGRALEKPAEAAFRQRMLDLLSKVQQSTSANSLRPTVIGASGEDGAARPYRRRGDPGSHLRDANIELLSVLLEALAKENDHLYHSLLTPITTYVMEILPEGHRETTKLELSFEDLENLLPDDVSRIVEWLTEKVDALSTKLKPEPKEEDEEEEENMGDVDLWSLTEETSSLTVNAKWLQHLQDRLLGEDGHPRRAKPGEDPGHNGLVLEWVYGSIVSTAEKARDGAKRCLGMQPPSAGDAHMLLVRALEEHLSWETRAKQCKDLLSEMLKSRLEAAELTRQGYDLRPQPKRDLPGMGGEMGQASASPLLLEDGASGLGMGTGAESKPLPDEVILFMLRREALLTRAKLHYLVFEHLTQEKELRILKQALRQGEPEFERLKRELDEVKHQPRGMEGAYRSAAEMERHRHQLEVQTAFREQGARLQATYDKKQKAEYDMAKRETEIKQLQGWKGTVENLVDKFQELIASRNERALAAGSNGAEGGAMRDLHEAEGDLEAASGSLTPQQYIQLTKLRNHFSKDVRKQLYGDADDRTFFDNLKTALKAIERRLEDSSVALQHLEMQLINVACDDPGVIIGTQLALPLLQDRLDQRGLEYAAQRAKLAEDEVLRMEILAAEREAAERERKKAAKAKKNEKAKSEKERLAAERQAKEAAERAARQEAERERAVRDEEERRKRAEAMEAMRKAEEAAMELRRKELLSDENGYWRQRMIMEERLSDMATGTGGSNGNAATAASSADLSEEADRHRSSSPEDARFGGGDDEGFVTENRRRRHKDTRDQDEEVAPPAPAPAQATTGQAGGSSGRAYLRSGSRDRMGPRDGVPQRERGEHHHQHPHRERDLRRHQGPGGAPHNRSGSRESGGRQAPHSSSSSGQQAPRPPLMPPAAPVPTPAADPRPESPPSAQPPAAEPVGAAEQPSAPAVELVATSSAIAAPEIAEQPAAPASASPAPVAASEAEAGSASSAAGGALPSPSAAPVPEDAILFGDIAVIPVAAGSAPGAPPAKPATQPPITPTPIPVLPSESPQKAVLQVSTDGQAAPAPSTAGAQAPQQQQTRPQQPAAGSTAAVSGAPALTQQPHPQQPPGPVLTAGSGASMPPPPQHGQGPAPVGTLPTGQIVHPIGHLPPGGLPGPLPGMVPPMMAHMAPPGPGGPPGAGPPRPQGPGAGPSPYMHINGGIPVPIPVPGGPMPPMGAVLPKQMSGQQMHPAPPPGPVLVSIGAPPGARPPMPGPGMPSGPPPPGMGGPPPQPGMQVAAPPQAQQQPVGPMARPPGPMPGMPGPPGAPAGLVQVPHPQAPGQSQHGQAPGVPSGAGPRGAAGPQGQPPVMISPMQFPGPMPGGAMALSHGQPPNGPMGHIPPHLYVFPPGTPGMVPPPGAPGQLQPHPHPHMLQMMPPGMPMPMGPPPQLHMQPPPPQQQAAGQAAPAVVSPGAQPPPPPKSPSAPTGAVKAGSTLNVNARSFVPSGKAAAASSSGAAVAAGQQAQPQPQPQGAAAASASSGNQSQPQLQQQQLASQRAYHRQGGGGQTDGAGMTGPGPQHGHPAAGAYPRVGPAGQYGGPGLPTAPGGGQYGNRRDRRDAARGPGGGGAGPRKGPGAGPAGPHAVMPPSGDMSGGPGMPPPHHHHAGAPPPMTMMGPAGPVMMVMGPAGPMQLSMHAPPHVSHTPGMEPMEGAAAAGPLDRPDSSAEDGSRPAAGDHPAGAPPAGGLHGGPPPQPPPQPPGHGPGAGAGPGPQHPVLAPPPPGMAPPGSRMMLTWQPGMPGPVQVPMMPVMPMPPMGMQMHMLQAAGGPPHGPNDGLVQKNGSAAESVRAPHSAQPQAAAAAAEADREGSTSGGDSAAAATATAPSTQTKDGGPSEAAGQDGRQRSAPSTREASPGDTEQQTPAAGPRDGLVGTAAPSQEQAPTGALAARAAPEDAAALPLTAASAAGAGQQQQRQQQQLRTTAAASSLTGLPSRVGTSGQSGPMPAASSAPSWSSVAARREGCAASSASGCSMDPFPSLVSSTASTSFTGGASDVLPPAATPHPGPAAGSSWKAKLQHNVSGAAAALANGATGAGGQKSPSALPNGVPGGGSPPVVVRGTSPGGTMNGSVSLASSLSDSAIANSSGVSCSGSNGAVAVRPAAPQRPPGNRPAGPALLSGAPTQLVGSLSLPASNTGGGNGHITYHPGVSGQPRMLQLVRGLQNLGGQHNCFLNVIIQSLWHLRSFREAVLHVSVDDVATRGAAAADVTVLRALVGVFRAMAAPQATQPASVAASSPWWVVSPLQLREALSVLETGQAAVRLDLSEMHDAFEVLLVLLTCMHRAEAGSGATQGQDPQLPRRVRVRDIAAAACAHAPVVVAAAAAANGHHAAPQAAAPAGYAAAVAGGGGSGRSSGGKAGTPADSAAAVPCTAAHSLFGLEVQVPCTAEEDSASCSSNGSAGGKERQQQQQQANRSKRDSSGGAGGTAQVEPSVVHAAPTAAPAALQLLPHHNHVGARPAADDSAAAEVEVYTKYFHLVHAQALRKAFAALDGSDSGAYFEDVLCAAEAAGAGTSAGPLVLPVVNGRRHAAPAGGGGALANGHAHHAHGWIPGATAAAHPLATLLRFPTVFTLALVWESLQAPPEALRGTLEALGSRVDLALLFRCSGTVGTHPPSAPCELRSVICYFGHHYLVFALSEELGLWLMIDDANIQLVGHWSDVVKAMNAKRLQPSLLFYEAVGRGRQLQPQSFSGVASA